MMKNKLSILTLTILFLVSTTGLPIYSHYCEMMGKKYKDECNMCETEVKEVEETSCCLEIAPEYQVQISEQHTRCCIDNFDYKKIEDNYSQSNHNLTLSNQIIIGENNLSVDNSDTERKYSQALNYNLPPPKFGKQLLQTIHQLKLDIPIS